MQRKEGYVNSEMGICDTISKVLMAIIFKTKSVQ